MKNGNAPENQTSRRILRIACATVLAVAFMGALPQPAHAQKIANELMLVNAKTGKCLTIAGGGPPTITSQPCNWTATAIRHAAGR